MTAQKLFITNCKLYPCVLFAFMVLCLLSTQKACSQVDYYYGENNKGFSISAGPNFTTAHMHFSENPIIVGFVGNLDYNFTPYFSIGGEAQMGTLQGIDKINHLQYSSSTNDFKTANLNFKVAVGAFLDFDSDNGFQDALKKLYVGVGAGLIKNSIVLTQGTNTSVPYGEVHPVDKYYIFPFNIGTDIDLRGVLGNDRFAINPNFQWNAINSVYADGFQSAPQFSQSKVGYYGAFSVKLKYKF